MDDGIIFVFIIVAGIIGGIINSNNARRDREDEEEWNRAVCPSCGTKNAVPMRGNRGEAVGRGASVTAFTKTRYCKHCGYTF